MSKMHCLTLIHKRKKLICIGVNGLAKDLLKNSNNTKKVQLSCILSTISISFLSPNNKQNMIQLKKLQTITLLIYLKKKLV